VGVIGEIGKGAWPWGGLGQRSMNRARNLTMTSPTYRKSFRNNGAVEIRELGYNDILDIAIRLEVVRRQRSVKA
jgi:hypothetical protein